MGAYRIIEGNASIQGSQEWLAWRRSKITASMSGIILGLSPYETPLQLYNKILSGEETPDNERMAHGRNTEAEARGWLSHHCECGYKPACMESIQYPWLACSLDAWDINCVDGIQCKAAEIKCPTSDKGYIYSLSEIPGHYYAQVQHQLTVSGLDKMIFLTYRKSDQSGCILEVKRDDLFIEKMIPILKAFYNRLAAFDPPDPIDGRDIFVLDDPEASSEALEYERACFEEQTATAKKEKLREKLISRAAGRSIKVGDLKITKVIRRGAVDYGQIEELKNVDLEKYRKKNIESWRFS